MGTIVIRKWGNSQGVRLPKHIMESCDLQIGDILEYEIKDRKLILQEQSQRKRRGKYKLEQLLEQIPDNFRKSECPWGMPIGKETW